MKIPCKKCITLPMCVSTFLKIPGPIALMVLAQKCILMKDYIYDLNNFCMMDKASEVEKYFESLNRKDNA